MQIERRSCDVVTFSVGMTDQVMHPNKKKVILVDHDEGNEV
jgi:hypothetical protein